MIPDKTPIFFDFILWGFRKFLKILKNKGVLNSGEPKRRRIKGRRRMKGKEEDKVKTHEDKTKTHERK